MIVIDKIILSDEIIEKQFVCNLTACKGACCVEGDSGAPLEAAEVKMLESISKKVLPYLTDEGKAAIEAQGTSVTEEGEARTPLINNRACAYVTFDEKGTALCAIEKAYNDKQIDFKKPVSCHLYPIRIKKYEDFEAVNYSSWDICDPACTLGKELQVPVYKFLKEPLIRKYGEDFYNVLDQVASGTTQQEQE